MPAPRFARPSLSSLVDRSTSLSHSRLRQPRVRHVRWHAQGQHPEQRQPQLARERHRSIVDQHLGGVVAADDLEQVLERTGILRVEARAVTEAVADTRLAVLGRRSRQGDRTLVVGGLEPRKRQREGERPRRRAEQGRVQVGIERRQFLRRGLFRQLGVRPEALARLVRWACRVRAGTRRTRPGCCWSWTLDMRR